jgi:hypothetical protein
MCHSSAPRSCPDQHIRVPDRKADHKRDGRVASGSARSRRTGVAMVRTHAMELVARYGARMRESIWAGPTKKVSCAMGRGCHAIHMGEGQTYELVRMNEDRGEAIDEQGSHTHTKMGPDTGENGRKEKRDAPDEGSAGAGMG